MNVKGKNIIIAPLDWGLGHASRCVPIVRDFLANGNKVVIASSGDALEFLKKEFPMLEFENLPSYKIRFQKKSVVLSLIAMLPSIIITIKEENKICNQLQKKYKADLIVSDNRYGFYSQNVRSVIITHQLRILVPKALQIFSYAVNFVNKYLLNKFNEVWIPDEEKIRLSGKLSDNIIGHKNVKFIGIRSRFNTKEILENTENEILAWVSGPEPHRTKLAEILKKQLIELNHPSTLVLGLPNQSSFEQIGNLKIYNHLETKEFEHKLQNASFVICRSGYSSLMDLTALNKKALLIPTPSQTEQEYLAEKAKLDGNFWVQKQEEIDLDWVVKPSSTN